MNLNPFYETILNEKLTRLQTLSAEALMAEQKESAVKLYDNSLTRGTQDYYLAARYNAEVNGRITEIAQHAAAEKLKQQSPYLDANQAVRGHYDLIREKVKMMEESPELNAEQTRELKMLQDAVYKFDAAEKVQSDAAQARKNFALKEAQDYDEVFNTNTAAALMGGQDG